jgi:hypothetical protein
VGIALGGGGVRGLAHVPALYDILVERLTRLKVAAHPAMNWFHDQLREAVPQSTDGRTPRETVEPA